VRRARYAKGWSIEQLSKRSGVPGRLIGEMESGSDTYVPSEANTVLLAEALKVAKQPATRNPRTLDPNPHAIPCNSGQSREQKIAYLCGICKPLQPSATTDRTLVMRLSQRFESARRLSLIRLYKLNTQNK
jgi:transcriptional regulator with XRE-family HTH domain